jgi:malonyl-CoA/methylmalonyl-CoA synthetase
MIPKYDDRTVWKLLLEEKDGLEINIFMAVPTIYKKLVDEYEKEELHKKADEIKRKFKHLRLMVSGSSALPENLF